MFQNSGSFFLAYAAWDVGTASVVNFVSDSEAWTVWTDSILILKALSKVVWAPGLRKVNHRFDSYPVNLHAYMQQDIGRITDLHKIEPTLQMSSHAILYIKRTAVIYKK